MYSYENFSDGFCRVEESNSRNEQHQVWPYSIQNQKFTHNYSCVTKSHSDILYAPSEDAMNADRTALLFGNQNTQIQTPVYSAAKMVSGFGKATPPKKHYAHISFVPSFGGMKPIISRKRKRTAFTTDQVTALEQVFQSQQYVTREERSVLVQRLSVGDQAIKVWFQNRRLRYKKELEEEQEEAQSLSCDMFAHTQSLLQHADQSGYVQLTQQSIDELVSAIDKHLPQNLDLNALMNSQEKESEESSSSSDSFHEPISPPEVSASEELSCSPQECWKVGDVDPSQSFQCLLDLLGSS